jgi:hypothetical protein
MTTVRFVFDPALGDIGEARWAMTVVASLLEAPHGFGPGAPGDPVVWIGRVESAPVGSAIIVEVAEWSPWNPDSIERLPGAPEPALGPHGASVDSSPPHVLAAPWLRGIAHLLSREEERHERHRDEWSCFPAFASRMDELGLLERAVINRSAMELQSRLDRWCAAHEVVLPRVERWPGGARFAAVLSHDVDWLRRDDPAEGMRLMAQSWNPRSYAFRHGMTSTLRALTRRGGAPDPFAALDRWCDEEAGRGFRSTFYVCPQSPNPRHPYDATYRFDDRFSFAGRTLPLRDALRVMRDRGFEIGLHGSYLSYDRTEALRAEREDLERALGAPVTGVRQHFLRFSIDTTWSAQQAAGFAYDATLGYNEHPGFRAGLAAPYRPWDPSRGEAHSLLALPTTVMDGALFRTLKLDARLAARRVLGHLAEVEEVGGLAVLLWHTNVLDVAHFPGWWRAYETVLNALQERRAWVATADDVRRWWEERLGRLAPST